MLKNNIVRALVLCFGGVAIACGGGAGEKPPVDDTTKTDVDQPPSKDEIFKYEAVELQGMRFEPQALGTPGMWKITTPKRATLKKQRKLAERKTAKAPDLQVFAALAWTESSELLDKARQQKDAGKKAKLEADAKKLQEEAREALRRARQLESKPEIHEVTLKLLSVAEMTLGDEERAADVYEEIVKKYPGKGATHSKIWLANLHLKNNRLAKAAALSDQWKLQEGLDPMAAYVKGWVAYRKRDLPAARDAILFAAQNWKSGGGRRAVSNDALLFLSRAATPVDQAAASIATLLGQNSEAEQYRWLYNLSKGYEFSGFPELAYETLDRLVSGKVIAEVPARDQVIFRAEMAYDALKAGMPGKTADASLAAHQKLADCGAECAKDAPNVTKALETYATLLHTLYAHSLDESYYEPAKKLYDYYLALPAGPNVNHDTMKGYADRLADTKGNAKPEQGKHDQAETQKLIKLRLNAVKACYEGVLQSEPELAGEVTLTINISEKGEVTGAETKPAKGAEGLAAVAACLQERARAWRFPGRTLAGTTAAVQPFNFSPAPPQQ